MSFDCFGSLDKIINSYEFYCSLNSAVFNRESHGSTGRPVAFCDLFSRYFLQFKNSQEVAEQKAAELNEYIKLGAICTECKSINTAQIFNNKDQFCTECKRNIGQNAFKDKEHFCTKCKFYAQNGYLNCTIGNRYLINKIEMFSAKFNEIYKTGEIDRALYGYGNDVDYKNHENCGKFVTSTKCKCEDDYSVYDKFSCYARYIVNRVVSVCDAFDGVLLGTDDDIFESNGMFRNMAVLCTFSEISLKNNEKTLQSLINAFVMADGCISNSSMIYLNLYKACGYVLFKAWVACENTRSKRE